MQTLTDRLTENLKQLPFSFPRNEVGSLPARQVIKLQFKLNRLFFNPAISFVLTDEYQPKQDSLKYLTFPLAYT